MERYERIFFWFSAVMLAFFLCTLAYVTVFMHIHLPGPAGRIIPKPGENLAAAVLTTPPFNHPGLREIAPGRYEAVILAQQWIFYPRKIEIPVGSEVTFKLTSADVIHGFFIPGTRINLMVVPGYISVETYRFTRSGNYRILCHEYCGREHQTMTAEVLVR
jgi:cytochrome c oxidase subunit II